MQLCVRACVNIFQDYGPVFSPFSKYYYPRHTACTLFQIISIDYMYSPAFLPRVIISFVPIIPSLKMSILQFSILSYKT
jgi:hypothetical protein